MRRYWQNRLWAAVWSLLLLLAAGAAGAVPRVGVFPGSFDPFHVGHLKVAQDAATAFALDEVVIVPNASNWRKPGMSPLESRHRAIQRTLEQLHDKRLSLLSKEEIEAADRAGPAETAPQRLFDAAAAARPGAKIYQILGSDSFAKIVENQALPKTTDNRVLVISRRPGEPVAHADVAAQLEKQGLLQFLPEENLDISSTRIRQAAREGDVDLLRHWLPAGVWRTIMKTGMYGLDESPLWPAGLIDLGADPNVEPSTGEAWPEGWMKDFPLVERAAATETFPLELPSELVQSIDFTASHTLGNVHSYLGQRLTPLGMKLIGRSDVEVYVVRGPRERLAKFLSRLGVDRALEITRDRSYITLGVVLGRRSNGRMVVAVGDVWGRERDLHTQSLIGGALAQAGRPAAGFRVVAWPAPVDDFQFMCDEYRRALQPIVPGTIDTVVIGYHWKVVQQLNARLAVHHKFPNRWTIRDGRISTTWRYRIDKESLGSIPQEGWSRRYLDHRTLPCSIIFYRDSAARPRTMLLTRNVYGDQLEALLQVLAVEKKIHRVILIGSCGGLNQELRIGDLILPTETASGERAFKTAEIQPWARTPRWLEGRMRPARVFSVFSPLEETLPRLERLQALGADVVDVEFSSMARFLESRPGRQMWSKALLIVSDLPGRGASLSELSDRELELEPAFIEMADCLIAELDIDRPSDHTIPLNH